MKFILVVILVLNGLALAADPPTTQHNPTTRASDEILEKLQADLKTVTTIEADFQQEKKLAVLDHVLKIRGHFALQKPNKMVWIVKEPVKYAIRIEGDELRQWDEDTNKVQIIHLGGDPTFKAITEQLQSWFIGDYKQLASSYDVFLEGENPLALGFTPKPGLMIAKVLKHIDVRFGQDNKYIDRMVVHEAGGDTTTLEFIDTKINEPVKKEVWEMPPHDR
jgi:outer membrane lipoprotein-sorting protein